MYQCHHKPYPRHWDMHNPTNRMDNLPILVVCAKKVWYTGRMLKTPMYDGSHDRCLFVVQKNYLDSLLNNPLFLSFYVTDIGFFPSALNHYRKRPEGCSENILLLCTSGSGYYRLGDQPPVLLTEGKAVVLPVNTPHEYAASAEDPWSIYWLHFGGEACCELYRMLEARQPITVTPSAQDEAVHWFHRCFDLLKRPYQTEEYHAICQYASALMAVIGLSGKQSEVAFTGKGSKAIGEAIRFMERNLHRSITLAELAQAACFSVSHLHFLFRSYTDYAPMEYFIRMKMQAASKDLFFSDKPVKEISASYGFQDSCYFSRMFKKIMGLTPQEYRNSMKG